MKLYYVAIFTLGNILNIFSDFRAIKTVNCGQLLAYPFRVIINTTVYIYKNRYLHPLIRDARFATGFPENFPPPRMHTIATMQSRVCTTRRAWCVVYMRSGGNSRDNPSPI